MESDDSMGAIPTSKETVAVLGMAKKGPMVRYRADVKNTLYLGFILDPRSSRPLLLEIPMAMIPKRGSPTPVIKKPIYYIPAP